MDNVLNKDLTSPSILLTTKQNPFTETQHTKSGDYKFLKTTLLYESSFLQTLP